MSLGGALRLTDVSWDVPGTWGCSELRKQKSTVIIVPFLTCKCPTAFSVNSSPFYACQNLREHNNFAQAVRHGLLFAQ